MSRRYRKKPITVEAIQYLREENIGECLDFCNKMIYNPEINEYEVETPEGNYVASKGDFIIKEGFRLCKPHVFTAVYEPV